MKDGQRRLVAITREITDKDISPLSPVGGCIDTNDKKLCPICPKK